MRKLFLILFMWVIFLILQGTTIIVDIEGAGDYTTIQAGINASTDGDEIIVFPGIYVENVDFMGKTIIVASRYMGTGNSAFIHQTIIDGNQSGSCVAVYNGEGDGTILNGFTITNGNGFPDRTRRHGGGIFINGSNIRIKNCVIEGNHAFSGGGLCISNSDVRLAGCTIRDNQATFSGGGIVIGCCYEPVVFSAKNRCNIYDNFAPLALDIHNSLHNGTSIDVIVDTFTVLQPQSYEFYQADSGYEQDYSNSIIDILHPKYERVYTDMYVSPDGDDANSGTSPNEAVQTINRALHSITADAENPLTVHVASGIYSTLLNNQRFPISLRGYVSIVGTGTSNTIMDLGIEHQGFAIDIFSDLGYEIKNFTVRNACMYESDTFYHRIFYIPNWYNSTEPAIFENLNIIENTGEELFSLGTMNTTLRNIFFYNNSYGNSLGLLCVRCYDYTMDISMLFEGCRFSDNNGGIISVRGQRDGNNQETHRADFVNCDFDNSDIYYTFQTFPVGVPLQCTDLRDVNIVNCTFGGNDFEGNEGANAPFYLRHNQNLEFVNNIVYGNDTDFSLAATGAGILNVHHNIIAGGLDGLYTGSYDELNWDEATVLDVDPLYLGEFDYIHQLQQNSPAINAGTFDLPAGIVLPQYDPAGNPRVTGNGVDLGAYEFMPWGSGPATGTENNNLANYNKLFIYPNPLYISQLRNAQAKILWQGETAGRIQFEIFNLKGQKIKCLTDFAELDNGCQTEWDLTGDSGTKVSSGVYFIRVKENGEYRAQQKVVLVK